MWGRCDSLMSPDSSQRYFCAKTACLLSPPITNITKTKKNPHKIERSFKSPSKSHSMRIFRNIQLEARQPCKNDLFPTVWRQYCWEISILTARLVEGPWYIIYPPTPPHPPPPPPLSWHTVWDCDLSPPRGRLSSQISLFMTTASPFPLLS